VDGKENLTKMFELGVNYIMSDDPAEAAILRDERLKVGPLEIDEKK
jgi:hypothetical protein